ncbi:ABC transporter permease [Georgenia sp. TF02-10]|uniref:ABC transporter permease n=1 Tax=Georgenia sp. TF02-10 TaxID=2917725 RepID=UPI001FA74728|nr:ABC transporter permease [Georgenia sp. TF02-10]UNX55337.1 ABC transporter permease [Georgenia sp. TF02-10]
MTTTAQGPAAVPRSRTGAGWRGANRLLGTETAVWLRDAGTVFFGVVFPSVVLLGVGFAIPGMRDPITDAPPPWDGLTPIATYLPIVLATAIGTSALTVMPVTLATFREKGVLRRLATTPMRPQGLIASHLVINLGATLVSSVVALAVGMLVFDAVAPGRAAVVLLAFVLAVAAMFALGTLVAARAARGTTASAIGMTIYFPSLLFAGLWTPGPVMIDFIREIGQFTPLGAASQAMTEGWFGDGFPALQMVVMVAWTAVLLPLGVKLFRWS